MDSPIFFSSHQRVRHRLGHRRIASRPNDLNSASSLCLSQDWTNDKITPRHRHQCRGLAHIECLTACRTLRLPALLRLMTARLPNASRPRSASQDGAQGQRISENPWRTTQRCRPSRPRTLACANVEHGRLAAGHPRLRGETLQSYPYEVNPYGRRRKTRGWCNGGATPPLFATCARSSRKFTADDRKNLFRADLYRNGGRASIGHFTPAPFPGGWTTISGMAGAAARPLR